MKSIFTLLCMAIYSGYAQIPVTAVFTSPLSATTATTYTSTGATGSSPSGFNTNTYTYDFGTYNVSATGNNHVLDSFTSFSMNFRYQPEVMSVQFRRVNNATVTGLRKDLWYYMVGTATVNAGGTVALYPDYDDSLERLFTERLFDVGIDNVFQNATTTDNNNIERMDVIFPGGVNASDSSRAGFVVFDRGSGTSHDPFYMAPITSLDASGNPLTYGNAVEAVSADYGNAAGISIPYMILRREPANARLLLMDNASAQNRDGVFFRFSDLGVPSHKTIFGYSLFGDDVVVSPASNLVTYTNATNYPITSDFGNGGLDPAAIAGIWITNSNVIILPEWFETFQAGLTNNQITLRWQLASMDGLHEMVVEKSTDGTTFYPVQTYTMLKTLPQTWIDSQPLPGENYYRLKLVNTEGVGAGYSTVREVRVPASGLLSVNIYPNPIIRQQFTFEATGLADATYSLKGFTMNGQPVFNQALEGGPVVKKTITLPGNLAAGIYIIQLADKSGNIVVAKTVVAE